jgi:hypothetical protein
LRRVVRVHARISLWEAQSPVEGIRLVNGDMLPQLGTNRPLESYCKRPSKKNEDFDMVFWKGAQSRRITGLYYMGMGVDMGIGVE